MFTAIVCAARMVYALVMPTTEYASLREKIAAEKAERVARYESFETLFSDAVHAGIVAGNTVVPEPMIVTGWESQPVMDGVCGFAWLLVKPGTSSFARWLVKTGKGRSSSYHGGVLVYIHAHDQSYTRKMAHARVMADVLSASPLLAKVRIYAEGRLD